MTPATTKAYLIRLQLTRDNSLSQWYSAQSTSMEILQKEVRAAMTWTEVQKIEVRASLNAPPAPDNPESMMLLHYWERQEVVVSNNPPPLPSGCSCGPWVMVNGHWALILDPHCEIHGES